MAIGGEAEDHDSRFEQGSGEIVKGKRAVQAQAEGAFGTVCFGACVDDSSSGRG
jgi:hypothetical protein